jgi:hypothetical protein
VNASSKHVCALWLAWGAAEMDVEAYAGSVTARNQAAGRSVSW